MGVLGLDYQQMSLPKIYRSRSLATVYGIIPEDDTGLVSGTVGQKFPAWSLALTLLAAMIML